MRLGRKIGWQDVLGRFHGFGPRKILEMPLIDTVFEPIEPCGNLDVDHSIKMKRKKIRSNQVTTGETDSATHRAFFDTLCGENEPSTKYAKYIFEPIEPCGNWDVDHGIKN